MMVGLAVRYYTKAVYPASAMIARSKETMTVEIASETARAFPCNVLRCPLLDSVFEGTELAISELLRISFDPFKSAFSPSSSKGMYGLSKPLASAFPGSSVFIVSVLSVDTVSQSDFSSDESDLSSPPMSSKVMSGLSKPFTSPFPGSFVFIVSLVCIDTLSHSNPSGDDVLDFRSAEIAEEDIGGLDASAAITLRLCSSITWKNFDTKVKILLNSPSPNVWRRFRSGQRDTLPDTPAWTLNV